MIDLFIPGIAKPAGSKRGFLNRHTGRVAVVDACAKSKDWKTDVKAGAMAAYDGELLTGPLRLDVRFVMQRPKSHRRSNGELKPNAPLYHTSKPDATKLLRAVEDALTGVVWCDDAQIAIQHVTKVYGDRPGASLSVSLVLNSPAKS